MDHSDVLENSYTKKINNTMYEIVTYTKVEGHTIEELLADNIQNKINSDITEEKKEETAEKK